MKKNLIGYGLAPNLIIMITLYLYYLSNALYGVLNIVAYSFVLGVTIFTFFFSIKYISKEETFIRILGFKRLSIEKSFLYFSMHYLSFLGLIYLFVGEFYQVISLYFCILIGFLYFLTLYYLKNKLVVQVLFIKITPRLYIDLIDGNLHTIEMIRSYDVIPIYEDELSLDKIDIYYSFLMKNNNNVKIDNNIKVNVDIEGNNYGRIEVSTNTFKIKEEIFLGKLYDVEELKTKISYIESVI